MTYLFQRLGLTLVAVTSGYLSKSLYSVYPLSSFSVLELSDTVRFLLV